VKKSLASVFGEDLLAIFANVFVCAIPTETGMPLIKIGIIRDNNLFNSMLEFSIPKASINLFSFLSESGAQKTLKRYFKKLGRQIS